MKRFDGWYLPEHEQHLPQWMTQVNQRREGRLAYQWGKIAAALDHVRDWRTCVDIGAHVGLWSYYLAPRFDRLVAFEPVAEHRTCFALNVPDPENSVTLHACALGEADGMVAMKTAHTSSGDTTVGGPGDIPLRRLDDFSLKDVDFMKLDCEGYELFALKGGEQTIRRCKPAIIVEQKPGRADAFGLQTTGAVEWLKGLGYTLRREMSGDFILSV